eukprot:Protomagalhaensia_wolfi_Nauph_80__491@NODE_1277_length_1615_cov_227_774746_g719_i1_p2_GENE_NODE_1277_length_1615_cov_227_774746_g719_i1NODE_1277_length_1615_cov_227_774746_g719_i1_p2_ORF_typecomplete_len126_score14_68_NODE_1277_length_1615_cov_227_774746_g719_i1178555
MNSNSTSAGTTPTSEGHYGSSAASLGAALKSQCVRAASWESVALSASVLCGINAEYMGRWNGLFISVLTALNAVLLKQPATKLYNQRLAKSVNPYVHTAIQQAKGFLSKIPMLTDQIVDSKTKKI